MTDSQLKADMAFHRNRHHQLQRELDKAKERIAELEGAIARKVLYVGDTKAIDLQLRIDAALEILQRNTWGPYSVDSVIKALTGDAPDKEGGR